MQEAKQSGFLGLFKRRQSTSPPAHVAGDGKEKNKPPPPPRRTYKPRYAERDMVLSMPVEQRPDLVAKANEARRRSVCSNIGFSTAGSMHSVSSHTRIASQNWSSRQMPTHPNFHLKLYGDSGSNAANSSTSSSQGAVMYGSDMYRTASSSTSMRDRHTHVSHAEISSSASEQNRPSSRSYHSVAAGQQTNSTSIEAVNQAYAELGISGADFEPERASNMSAVNRCAGYAAHASHSMTADHSTARQRSAYFRHKEALPNLKGEKGKGKGKGKEGSRPLVATQGGRSDCGGSCRSEYSDDRESYVCRTAASPTLPSRAAPAPSGHSREPSMHESSSSSFAGSIERQNGEDFWSRTDSQRNPSTSTLMTSYTEASEVMPPTAQSQTADTCDRRDFEENELQQPANDSKQEDADNESDYNDETPDAKTEHFVELRDDIIERVQSLPGA